MKAILRTPVVVALLAAAPAISCRSFFLMPPTDLSAPGWKVRQGQAVWKPMRDKPELAGELLLATHAGGGFFIQFSKIPFPLVVAQCASNRWQIEFGNHDYVRCGRGAPPARFVWFHLPRFLAGGSLGPEWRTANTATNTWRLENSATGEAVEGYLSP